MVEHLELHVRILLDTEILPTKARLGFTEGLMLVKLVAQKFETLDIHDLQHIVLWQNLTKGID